MNRKQKANLIADCYKQGLRDAHSIFGLSDGWGEWTVAQVEKHLKGISRIEAIPRCCKVPSILEWKQTIGNRKTNEGEDLGSVEVSYDSHQGFFDVVGRSVAYVRANLQPLYNIAPDALPIVTVQGVRHALEHSAREEEFILTPNSRLEFMYDFGVKGLGALLTPAQLKRLWKLTEAQYREFLAMDLPTIVLSSGEVFHLEQAVDEWSRRKGWIVESIESGRLTPQTVVSAATTLQEDTTGLWHSPDYRVCKDRSATVHNLSKEVAKLVEAFNVCLKEGIAELTYDMLLEKAITLSDAALVDVLDFKKRYPQRLDHLLRRAKVWNRLVESGTKRGWYRLIV